MRARDRLREAKGLDCFVARAPRNDELTFFHLPLNVIASEAKQSSSSLQGLDCVVASLFAMTELAA
jgi:hypothetical protein